MACDNWQRLCACAILATTRTMTPARVAGMAKLADAADLKSAGAKALWGFDSPSRHQSKGNRLMRLSDSGRFGGCVFLGFTMPEIMPIAEF
jgi:hypothetical protein